MLRAFEYEPLFNKTVLENGVRVITEHHPSSRAVAAGIFIDQGTRDEPENLIGAAHFVEHMVFKGTETRDAYEIARSLEAVGGEINAYTTREQTCFHATSLKEHLELSLDVLSDLMSNAEFEISEFKKEREVITQEIHSSMDELDEFVFDLAFQHSYKGHELARSILGTPKTLQQITRRKLMDFYLKRYHGENMIVCVAGHVNHEDVVRAMRRTLSLRRKPTASPVRRKPSIRNFRKYISTDAEQEHVLVTFPAVSIKDRTRFEAYVANAALGGGMTSKLYQRVREKHGLAYSVYSYLQQFTDSGLFMIYAGTSTKHLPKVFQAIVREAEALARKGLSQSELDYYRTQIIGSLLLESDDIESRMNSLGFNEMVFGENRPVDKVVADLERVTVESMALFLKRHFDISKAGVIVLGDINEDRVASQIESLMGPQSK